MKTYQTCRSTVSSPVEAGHQHYQSHARHRLFASTESRQRCNEIDFDAEEALVPIGPPRKIWVSDGVQHIRDFPVAGPVWGDLNGTLTVIANINLDLATGDGTTRAIKDDPTHPLEPTADWIWYKPREWVSFAHEHDV